MPDIRVLIVEDNDTVRFLTTRQISVLGFTFETAVNGKEAVERYRNDAYDVILMDIMMPEMTGLEATRQIRKIEQEKGAGHIPIIAMTAYGERSECLESGMDDYLFKPVKLEDLRVTLTKWLTVDIPTPRDKLLDKTDRELSRTKEKLGSIGDRIAEIKRKYGLS